MLKLQYFGHLMQRAYLLEKTLMLGNIEGRRRRGKQRTRWLDGITDSTNMSLSKLKQMVKDREAWCFAVHGAEKSRTWLSNWTTATCFLTALLSHCILSLPWVMTIWTYPLDPREAPGGWSPLSNKHWGTQEGFFAQEPHRVLLGFTSSMFVPLNISPTPNLWPPPSPLVTTVLLSDFMNLAF